MYPEWHNVRSTIRVTRIRDVYDRKKGVYKCSTEVSYYVCNRILPASTIGMHIRFHWHIENKFHHVKDATFREDYNRKEEKPENFSLCIDFALNILKYNKIYNIKGALYEISLSVNKRLSNLAGLVC
jgi:predicted transposase YbfD/YdcC